MDDISINSNQTLRYPRRTTVATNDETSRVRGREEELDETLANEPPPQVPRLTEGFVMPDAYNDNARSNFAIDRTTIVPLNILTRPGAEPSMRCALVAQILRIIVHNPNVQNGSSAQTYSRPRSYGPVHSSSMPYTMLLLCCLFSETEGNLLIYLMESPSLNKNTNLWLNNVELRDNGTITVGTVFRIVSPLPVTNYLRGDIPLIETQQPVIVLKQPSRYGEILPVDNLQGESSRAFIINRAELSCNAYSCEKTKCGGSFCDRQRVNEWNTPVGSCGCYSQRSRGTNNLTLLYPFLKATHEGKTYTHRDFSSHSFTMQLINRDFPIGVQANDLQLSDAYWRLGDSIEEVLSFVNEKGGWTIAGWYSRGVINDRTLTGVIENGNSNSNNINNAEVQVDGAELTYHFCKIVPTDSTLNDGTSVDSILLNTKKFDVETIGS